MDPKIAEYSTGSKYIIIYINTEYKFQVFDFNPLSKCYTPPA